MVEGSQTQEGQQDQATVMQTTATSQMRKPPLHNNAAVNVKSADAAMQLTNQEFFNSSMYFTDEVRLRLEGDDKFVNEFLVCNNIGRGSYSKVKRVIRVEKNQMHHLNRLRQIQRQQMQTTGQVAAQEPTTSEEQQPSTAESQQAQVQEERKERSSSQIRIRSRSGSRGRPRSRSRPGSATRNTGTGESGEPEEELVEFAMKMMHKPTLKRERAIRYDKTGEMLMINNLDKVYSEIELWTQLNHPYIAKLYEMIDDDNHDYLYLILEMADLGQIANWDFQQERYVRNEQVYNFVKGYLEDLQQKPLSEQRSAAYSEPELVAQYVFRQLAAAIAHLHNNLQMIHRDIKPDNILFSSATAETKLTDFTCSRGELESGVKLFDSEGTPCFTAPECHIVQDGGYDPRPTDIWSFGVVLYTFVHDGRLPFYGQSELEIQINSREQDLVIPDTFSEPLRDLMSKVLSKDPTQRPTALDLLQHPFFETE